jgi:hypothetical protein
MSARLLTSPTACWAPAASPRRTRSSARYAHATTRWATGASGCLCDGARQRSLGLDLIAVRVGNHNGILERTRQRPAAGGDPLRPAVNRSWLVRVVGTAGDADPVAGRVNDAEPAQPGVVGAMPRPGDSRQSVQRDLAVPGTQALDEQFVQWSRVGDNDGTSGVALLRLDLIHAVVVQVYRVAPQSEVWVGAELAVRDGQPQRRPEPRHLVDVSTGEHGHHTRVFGHVKHPAIVASGMAADILLTAVSSAVCRTSSPSS